MARKTPTFAKYQVVAELDHGGMADVYLCMAKGPGGFSKLHVLKCVKEELLGGRAESNLLEMFLDEAKLAAQLNHPNVVQTFEVGGERERFFIAMEYLEGQSLSMLLRTHPRRRNEPLPRALHLRILCEAMQGLHYAHELCDLRGSPLYIIHRDVSPQNVFITYLGAVKVLDFGIAKAAHSTTTTQAGTFKGKVSYAAPEQISGDGPIDRRVDIFAMGILLWHAAVGRTIWRGESDIQKIAAILSGDLPRPTAANPAVPAPLEAIVTKAMSMERDERFQTMAELRRAVESYLVAQEPAAAPDERSVLMGELFAMERTDIAARLREHVEKIEIMGDSVTPIRLSDRPGVPSVTTSVGNAVVPHGAVDATPRRNKLLFGGALGLSGAMAVVGILGIRAAIGAKPGPSAEAAPATPPSQTAAAASTEVAPPKTVRLSVSVTPKNAHVSVDGTAVEGSPYVGTHPSDTGTHRVRAEAPGFLPAEKTIALDQDHDINFTLQPLQAHAPPTKPNPTTSATSTTPGAKPIRKIEKEDPYK